MAKRLVRSVKSVVCATVLFGAGAAHAVDGVIEINDTSIAAAGGYPFTIGAAGSYVLTGNLTPPPGIGALDVPAPAVEIDLNGFSLIGGGVAGVGITIGGGGVTVKNGTITGFGGAGITGAFELKVFKTRISANGGGGIIGATDCLIVESTIGGNLGDGILASDCKIENNIIFSNMDDGIEGPQNVIVHNKIANNGFGGAGGGILSPGESTIQENVILRNFGFGVSDMAGAPPAPVPAPPLVPFPPAPIVGIGPNNVMKNVIEGGAGPFLNIGVFAASSALVSDNTVTGHSFDGIVCSVGCTVRGNVVHSNNLSGAGNGGMTIGPGSIVSNNSIGFNAGIGLLIDPTATWTQNTLNANGAQNMSLLVPPAPAPHPSSGFLNTCSGFPAPVPGVGPVSCP